jgi:hypothetical protein
MRPRRQALLSRIMYISDYSCVVFQWRIRRRGSLDLTRKHGRLEVKHVSHPVILIDAAHHMCQLSERITAENQFQPTKSDGERSTEGGHATEKAARITLKKSLEPILPFRKALHKLQVALVGASDCVYPPSLGLSPPAVRQVGFARRCQ